jgi:hypothetical protein
VPYIYNTGTLSRTGGGSCPAGVDSECKTFDGTEVVDGVTLNAGDYVIFNWINGGSGSVSIWGVSIAWSGGASNDHSSAVQGSLCGVAEGDPQAQHTTAAVSISGWGDTDSDSDTLYEAGTGRSSIQRLCFLRHGIRQHQREHSHCYND